MDGALKSKRMYPAYTTAQLESFVADIKANETGGDACMRMIAMQDEIDRRKAGLSPVTVIPQLASYRLTLQVFEVEGESRQFETVANVHNVESEQAAVDKLFRSLKSGSYRFIGNDGIMYPSCLK